jgi:hypothetical protein
MTQVGRKKSKLCMTCAFRAITFESAEAALIALRLASQYWLADFITEGKFLK